MAIENPLLGTQQISDMRRPDVGDPGAPYRALGNAVKTGIEVAGEAYRAKKVGELTGELEAERQKYIAEQEGMLVEDESTPEEDVFSFGTEPSPPDEKNLNAFVRKMTALDKANRAGTINATELRIRQEKILREAMNAQPWLADEYVRAASRSQGYNPIGAKVDALADAEAARLKDSRAHQEWIDREMVKAGVPAYLRISNPVEFYRIGIQMANSAMALQTAQYAVGMAEAEDKLNQREMQRSFNRIVADGALSSLPGYVTDYVSDWENAVATGMWSQSPETQAMFQERAANLAAYWQSGGEKYTEILNTLLGKNPTMDLNAFRIMWDGHVNQFIGLVTQSRTPQDARNAIDSLVNAPLRNYLLDHPDFAMTNDLARTMAPYAQIPEMRSAAVDLANLWVQQAAPLLHRPTVQTPDGVKPNPLARVPGVGTERDVSGEYEAGERERRDFNARVGALASDYPNSKDPTTPDRVAVASTKFVASQTAARSLGPSGSYPSNTARHEWLATITNPSWFEAMQNAHPTVRLESTLSIADELDNILADITTDLKKDLVKREGIDFDANNGKIEVYADAKTLEVRPTEEYWNDLQAQALAGAINREYGMEFARVLDAYTSIAKLDISYNYDQEKVNKGVAKALSTYLFNQVN